MLAILEFVFYCIKWGIEHWLEMIFAMGGVVLVLVVVVHLMFKGNNNNNK